MAITTTKDAGRWIASWSAPENPRLTLICLGHVGSGAGTFHRWRDSLDADVALAAVRLPGRESRIRDAPIDSPRQVVDHVAEALRAAELVNPSSVLVGVCSGALLMFEVARVLQDDGRPLGGLVAVSQSAPHRHEPQPRLSRRPIPEALETLGLTDDAILRHDRLLKALEPAIRADLRLVERYTYRRRPPLTLPIGVVRAERDRSAPPDALAAWRHESVGDFAYRSVEGTHLFAGPGEPERLVAAVAQLATGMRGDRRGGA